MKHLSPEAPREPVIPATASDGLAPVPGAGAAEQPAVAVTRPAGSHLETEKGGFDSRSLAEARAGREDGSTPSHVSGETNGTAGPAVKASAESGVGALHPLPKRRELSYPLAALAYTWAAIERRTRC